jgi:hypothetical protein
VLKKKHFAIDEVVGILKRNNLDKREADMQTGKREHEFFLSKGSKVGSLRT